ncbi:hypothetical protein HU200_041808 [Digitaria exilis]|uniref:DUF1618 domain-containing protein n=1 Tax=Digitaria exilis TaxID=1010633 RepID=A0A835B3M3_9POAL|nr:hypothetical protein HU200_041808 [Digitaria exilis]
MSQGSPMNDARLLSIPPPIHPEDPDSPPPESILLDPFGYLSDRTNATTADGRRSRSGKRILVTFWVASPPRVSCFTVHCPDLKANTFGDIPKVIYAEHDLVLLRIAICRPDDHDDAQNIRYFVYQAGTKNKPPSLKMIRTPPYFKFPDTEVTLLRCRDKDMFYLAVLRRAFIDWKYADKQFDLHLYNSKTESWSTKLMHVDSLQDFNYFSHNKVITIGGEFGSVGWVDLWRGILICDLLVDNHRLCFVPLPSPLVPKPLRGYPMYLRNIIVLDGYIKYFEMHNHVAPVPDTGNGITEGWVAAIKMMKISSIGSGNNWDEDCTSKFSDVPLNCLGYAQMLQQVGGATKPTLKRIQAGYPALSMHDRDVVYIMHRPNHREHKSFVIALDMRNKTIKGVADFGSGRPLGYGFTYLQCEISKHMCIGSSTTYSC